MQVDKLPKEIQEIALERHKEQRDRINFTGGLTGVFTWGDTKEGHDFWYQIDEGNFDDFYKKYPRSEDKGFKIGDVVEVINCTVVNRQTVGLKFTVTQTDVDVFNGRVPSSSVKGEVYHFENNKHGVNFTLDMLKLVETKQHYTSIPKEVKVGDTFEIIGGRGFGGNDMYNYDWPIGSIVTLEYNDGTFCPSFRNKDGDTLYLDWGWLKPVESKSSAKKSDLLPVGTIVRISAKGKKEYSNGLSNPHDETGEIIVVRTTEAHVYKVRLQSGSTNTYKKDEIEEVVNDKSNNYGFSVGDEVWYTDDAISTLNKSQEHNVKYVITQITKGRDTLGVIVEMKSDAGNVSINTHWLQKKENSSINKLNIQQDGSKSSSTIVGSSKCTGSESIALHGISASIICGTTPRGEIVSCSRAEIKLGN